MNSQQPHLRADLQLVESAPGINGAPQWVLADPITGRYFTLTPTALRLLRHWSLRHPQQILVAANNEPGLPLHIKELEQLMQFLRQHDLVAASDPEQRQRYLGKAKTMCTSLWKSLLHQYLFFRIPLCRPDPVLNLCWPWLQRYGAVFLTWGISAGIGAGAIFGQPRLGALHPFLSPPVQPVRHGGVWPFSGFCQVHSQTGARLYGETCRLSGTKHGGLPLSCCFPCSIPTSLTPGKPKIAGRDC
ncbi:MULTISPECIES: hypothetical protein [Symbiopectobacterium]|uniref:hypothetical protein n=1 Tax=Candidatus Symbiopectobacterium sp. PLON1 TaxID=2794575 RepID=UPI002079E8FE|nr:MULTISPECIES: hypothetical protein [Symbiopectobacterium]